MFSQFGDRLVQIVLIGFVYKISPGSTLQLAKLLAFTVIPAFFISPIAGVYIDRWDKKAVMLISDIMRGLLVLLVLLFLTGPEHIVPLYAVLFLIFASACFFLPAKFSIIPDMVSEDKLLMANSIVSITAIVAGVAGFALGGVMLEVVDLKWGIYVNSLVYLVSGACLLFVTSKTRAHMQNGYMTALKKEITKMLPKSFFHDLREGFRHLLAEKDIHFVVYTYFILMSAVGAVYVVLVVFVQDILGSMTKDVGLFGLVLCMGLLLGSLFYGRVGHKVSKNKAIFVSLVASGFFIAGFAAFLKLTASFFVGAGFMFLTGAAISPVMICANTIMHEVVDAKMRGRIFSAIGIVMNIGMLLFMFIASTLAEFVDRMWILVGAGSLFLGCGLIGLVLDQKKGITSR